MTPDQPNAARDHEDPMITVSRDDVLIILHQRPHDATEYGRAYTRLAAAATPPEGTPS